MIITKSREEIELMREAALVVSRTLGMLATEVKVGVTTNELNTMAEAYIREQDAVPGFLGLYDCPSTLLTSVNEAIVHGLPTDVPLKEGDIVIFPNNLGVSISNLDINGKKLKKGIFLNEDRLFGICTLKE